MALQIASDLVPSSGGTFYLMEDVYLKGSFSVRDNIADRDKIAIANLKVGQLVLTIADKKIWMVTELVVPSRENPDAVEKVTWEEFITNGISGGGGNGPGDINNGSYGPNSRVVMVQTVDTLPVDTFQDFTLEMAASSLVLKLETSRPVRVLAYGTPDRDEVNPYEFVSTEDHLADDGRQMLPDGTIFRTRNYSIFANFENPATNNIYFTVKSVDEGEGPVVITLTFVPIELVKSEEEDSEEDTGENSPTP